MFQVVLIMLVMVMVMVLQQIPPPPELSEIPFRTSPIVLNGIEPAVDSFDYILITHVAKTRQIEREKIEDVDVCFEIITDSGKPQRNATQHKTTQHKTNTRQRHPIFCFSKLIKEGVLVYGTKYITS
mmetsp:Transcript_6104/g.8782  ORF Transcript_6104/g.8782 Transcript_6104/m.8782 type:complete len:127 (-) Transcript_6104:36-416(-)